MHVNIIGILAGSLSLREPARRLLEIEWILVIHNHCIFPYNGYSMGIVWIYYGFSGAIANFVVWISHFFSSV
jgi:hypothetical protein